MHTHARAHLHTHTHACTRTRAHADTYTNTRTHACTRTYTVCGSVAPSTFTSWCHRPHRRSPEHFSSCTTETLSLLNTNPSLPPTPGTTVHFLSLNEAVLGASGKWSRESFVPSSRLSLRDGLVSVDLRPRGPAALPRGAERPPFPRPNSVRSHVQGPRLAHPLFAAGRRAAPAFWGLRPRLPRTPAFWGASALPPPPLLRVAVPLGLLAPHVLAPLVPPNFT